MAVTPAAARAMSSVSSSYASASAAAGASVPHSTPPSSRHTLTHTQTRRMEACILRFVASNSHRPPSAAVLCAALAGSVGASARAYEDDPLFGALIGLSREQVHEGVRGLIRARKLRSDHHGIVVADGTGMDMAAIAGTQREVGSAASTPHVPVHAFAPMRATPAGAASTHTHMSAGMAARGNTTPATGFAPAAAGTKRPMADISREVGTGLRTSSVTTGESRFPASARCADTEQQQAPARGLCPDLNAPRTPLQSIADLLAPHPSGVDQPRGGMAPDEDALDLSDENSNPLADPAGYSAASSVAPAWPPERDARTHRAASAGVDAPELALLFGSGDPAAGAAHGDHRPKAAAAAAAREDDDPLASLSFEQRAVYDMVMAGHSVFFTGSAGTGKSHLLRVIIEGLREHYSRSGRADAVFITAPTGIAACNIGGTTVHSFAGIGQGSKSAAELAAELERSRGAASKRWKSAAVIVIDEVRQERRVQLTAFNCVRTIRHDAYLQISMLDGATFDKLEHVARRVRHTDRPFGGLQLVLAGDFCQLPPIGVDSSPSSTATTSRFAGRGRGGPAHRGRGGRAAGSSHTTASDSEVKFCFEAECWNRVVYAQVSLTQVFRQKDPAFIDLLNHLRVGKITPETEKLLKAAGRTVAEMERTHGIKPTRIYALNRDVDRTNAAELSKCPGSGQEFSARDEGDEPYLSTLVRNCPAPDKVLLKRTAQVILLKNIDAERGLVNGARGVVVDFQRNAEGQWPELLPVVEFERGAEAPIRIAVDVGVWSTELGGLVVAQRSQIPLKLAYALSIHKSQGMGISSLEVSLQGVFEYGQAYVALSRAVSLDRVRVTGFSPSAVRAHPRVLQFYERLRSMGKPLASAVSKPPTASAAPTATPKPGQRREAAGAAGIGRVDASITGPITTAVAGFDDELLLDDAALLEHMLGLESSPP